MDKFHAIAKIMCDITDEIINDSLFEFKNVNFNKVKLYTRIGSGLATYCKHERNTDKFIITYGRKMIESKFSQRQIKSWLTYREIIKHNYFNSDTSLNNVLTHTICHEFAHLIQQLTKEIKRGSIHNASFYKILNTMYKSGLEKEINSRITQRCRNLSIKLEFDTLDDTVALNTPDHYSINDEITFIHKKKKVCGTIIKINRKTLIICSGTLFKKTHWKVPKTLIEIKHKD